MAKKTTDETVTEVTENTTTEAAAKAAENEEDMVKITLPKDRTRKSKSVYVGVNGVAMLIPIGVEVEIPRRYYNALKEREADIDAVENFMEKQREKNNA